MIGVFDSGIGGLTLLFELQKAMPNEEFMYYADTDNVPYSYKTPNQIKTFVEDAVLFLHQQGCGLVVLACNTATNVAIAYLREQYTFPIVAIQPAVKLAADHNHDHKRILSCATPITLSSVRYQQLLDKLGVRTMVDNLPLPKLVEFAENENFDSAEVLAYLKTEFSHFTLENYQFIVLGCTHFTFFEALIETNFPPLKTLDGNAGTAKRVAYILEEEHLAAPTATANPSVTFYESGRLVQNPARFLRFLERLKVDI